MRQEISGTEGLTRLIFRSPVRRGSGYSHVFTGKTDDLFEATFASKKQ